jgi:hypothetical protein
MRRVLAATAAIWAVLAIALVLAITHRPSTASQASPPATIVLIRQANGKLTAVPASTQATTQTSGAPAGSQVVSGAPSAEISAVAPAPANHATTRTS